ncbi:MAG: phytoene/squalene synthase family protein [Planctomycetota bacterium]|nr:phytoene/squalene synthase family protein [Planctomycetota bacterium]
MTTVLEARVSGAMEHCRRITRAEARNFYYGLKLAPEPKRSALYTIYAWMRRADDLVDDLVDETTTEQDRRGERLERFREETDAALEGNPVDDDPVWIGLSHVVDCFGLDASLFHDMLDGQLEDLGHREYETFDDLRRYCYRVASTVGLICITIWGYEQKEAEAIAIDRGIAFQLTNIIRDFREDFDIGRIYLPRCDFQKHGLTPRQMREGENPDAAKRFILQQIDRAESYYQKSESLESMIHPSCAPSLWAMTSIYRGTLDKIRRDPGRLIGDRRISLNSLRKSSIALQAKWRSFKVKRNAPLTPEESS